MPSTYSGTREERLTRLEQRGQRCDGQNRGCTQTAVQRFTRIAINPTTGEVREGAEVETVQGCSKHRRPLGDNSNYRTLTTENLKAPDYVTEEHKEKARQRYFALRELSGCTFRMADDGPLLTCAKIRYNVDHVVLYDAAGTAYDMRQAVEIHRRDKTTAEPERHADDERQVSIPMAVRFSG